MIKYIMAIALAFLASVAVLSKISYAQSATPTNTPTPTASPSGAPKTGMGWAGR